MRGLQLVRLVLVWTTHGPVRAITAPTLLDVDDRGMVWGQVAARDVAQGLVLGGLRVLRLVGWGFGSAGATGCISGMWVWLFLGTGLGWPHLEYLPTSMSAQAGL